MQYFASIMTKLVKANSSRSWTKTGKIFYSFMLLLAWNTFSTLNGHTHGWLSAFNMLLNYQMLTLSSRSLATNRIVFFILHASFFSAFANSRSTDIPEPLLSVPRNRQWNRRMYDKVVNITCCFRHGEEVIKCKWSYEEPIEVWTCLTKDFTPENLRSNLKYLSIL